MGHSRTSKASLASSEGRQWETVSRVGEVHFIQKKTNSAKPITHTHTKTKVYVTMHEKPGKEFGKVKEISIMNPKTGQKMMDIHSKDESFGPHVHHWKNGDREKGPGKPLTRGQQKYLDRVIRMAKDSK